MSLFECHDAEPGPRELPQHHRAAGPRANDYRVDMNRAPSGNSVPDASKPVIVRAPSPRAGGLRGAIVPHNLKCPWIAIVPEEYERPNRVKARADAIVTRGFERRQNAEYLIGGRRCVNRESAESSGARCST